jgi:hypothetical protein
LTCTAPIKVSSINRYRIVLVAILKATSNLFKKHENFL